MICSRWWRMKKNEIIAITSDDEYRQVTRTSGSGDLSWALYAATYSGRPAAAPV